VILFRPEHVEPILSVRKTQTRRAGNKRWNVGSIHQCKTTLFSPDPPFARVRIFDVRRQKLGEMSREEVLAEGYRTWPEYMKALGRIHEREFGTDDEVWVVTFEVVP
jgi:hypothetical protein